MRSVRNDLGTAMSFCVLSYSGKTALIDVETLHTRQQPTAVCAQVSATSQVPAGKNNRSFSYQSAAGVHSNIAGVWVREPRLRPR